MLLSMILQVAAGASISKAAAALGAALAALAGAYGISKIGSSALDAGARQPEEASNYRMTAIIIGALVEGACLFAILVCLLGIL